MAFFDEVRRLHRRLAFSMLHGLSRLGRIGGQARLAQLGRWVGDLHYALAFAKRRALKPQLARALGLPNERDAAAILRSAYRSGDRAVLEVIAMCADPVPECWIERSLGVEGLARLRAAAALGRGVLLIGMHMGNGILLAAWLARHGIEVSLVHKQSRRMPDGALARCIEQHGVEGICARQHDRAYREMVRAIKRGRVVFVLMDQGAKCGGLPVRLLGKDIMLASGPPVLALRTGAALMTAFATGDDPGGWCFRIDPPIDLTGRDAQGVAELIAAAMDSHIRAHPQMWTWHHRRWRNYPFPAESARTTRPAASATSSTGGSQASVVAGIPVASPAKEVSSTSSW